MLKVLLPIIILFHSLYAIEISKSKEFTLEHKPVFMQTSFEVTIENKNQNIIEKKIQQVSKHVKSAKICKGGQYKIVPNYRWEHSKKIDLGFRSNISYECKFSNKKDYEALLDKVKNVNNIKLEQRRIRFIQTKKEKLQKTSELENMAFKFAKSYVKKLNKSFDSCKIDSINLHSNYSAFTSRNDFVKSNKVMAESKSIVSTPIDDKFKNSINVNYKFSCE